MFPVGAIPVSRPSTSRVNDSLVALLHEVCESTGYPCRRPGGPVAPQSPRNSGSDGDLDQACEDEDDSCSCLSGCFPECDGTGGHLTWQQRKAFDRENQDALERAGLLQNSAPPRSPRSPRAIESATPVAPPSCWRSPFGTRCVDLDPDTIDYNGCSGSACPTIDRSQRLGALANDDKAAKAWHCTRCDRPSSLCGGSCITAAGPLNPFAVSEQAVSLSQTCALLRCAAQPAHWTPAEGGGAEGIGIAHTEASEGGMEVDSEEIQRLIFHTETLAFGEVDEEHEEHQGWPGPVPVPPLLPPTPSVYDLYDPSVRPGSAARSARHDLYAQDSMQEHARDALNTLDDDLDEHALNELRYALMQEGVFAAERAERLFDQATEHQHQHHIEDVQSSQVVDAAPAARAHRRGRAQAGGRGRGRGRGGGRAGGRAQRPRMTSVSSNSVVTTVTKRGGAERHTTTTSNIVIKHYPKNSIRARRQQRFENFEVRDTTKCVTRIFPSAGGDFFGFEHEH